MNNIIDFNLTNLRTPSGAVEKNTVITFKVKIPRSFAFKNIFVTIEDDFHNIVSEKKLKWMGFYEDLDVYSIDIKLNETGLYWYFFKGMSFDENIFISKKDGSTCFSDIVYDRYQITVFDEKFTTPDWIKGGIFYQIFVDRFYSKGEVKVKDSAVMHENWNDTPYYKPVNGEVLNNDFFGGNLKGIISKLDYIKSLGTTCIYLNPIFEAYSNHKYDTADYMNVDSMFGTNEDFITLCSEAKKRGMYVILDGVFNHTGSDSIYFNKKGNYNSLGAYQSTDSPYYSWYSFGNFPDDYESWWGIKTLPQVNENDKSYQNFILGENGVIKTWLRRGAMGFRLDVADELPDSFLKKIRKSLKDENNDALLIGEVWENASNKIAYEKRKEYLFGEELDSVMNYPFKNAIIDFIRNKNEKALKFAINDILNTYPKQVTDCLMNMLSTHDTVRIITALAGENMDGKSKEEKENVFIPKENLEFAIKMLKMASLIQYTLPGVPCLFYADEAGLEGYEDPLNRRCYPYGMENEDLIEWYTLLGKIRNKNEVFIDGDLKLIYAKDGAIVYKRTNGKSEITVGVNRGENDITIDTVKPHINLLTGKKTDEIYILKSNEMMLLK